MTNKIKERDLMKSCKDCIHNYDEDYRICSECVWTDNKGHFVQIKTEEQKHELQTKAWERECPCGHCRHQAVCDIICRDYQLWKADKP